MVSGEQTFVDETRSAIVLFDMLSSELIKSSYSDDCFVILVSPWVKDYAIPPVWPSFSSNFFSIKNMQKISDIIKKLCENNVHITLLTKSKSHLESEKHPEWSIPGSIEFHDTIQKYGVKICYHADNHAKHAVTSGTTFITSANITHTGLGGMQGNAGTYGAKKDFPNWYKESLDWCIGKIKESENPDVYFSK